MDWRSDWYDDWWSEDDWGAHGSGRQRRSTEVIFYRPDGDSEGKDIGWCLDNGFHEIEDGLWSGDWYYEHHPDYKEKKKEEERRKNEQKKKISPGEAWERAKKRRRAELLDEIYNGAYNPHHPMYDAARKELDALDETVSATTFCVRAKVRHVPKGDIPCPLAGCQAGFETNDELKGHLEIQTGKGHDRYRRERGIVFRGWEPAQPPEPSGSRSREECTNDSEHEERKQEARCVAPPKQERQRPPTPPPPPPLPPDQSDIRSFFSSNKPAPPLPSAQSDIRTFFKPTSKTNH